MKKTLSLVAILAAGTSQAAGFQIDTQGARATGTGGAATAWLEDSSSIYYNVANMVGVKTLDITLGDTGILPSIKFQRPGQEAEGQRTTLSPPPHLFVVYKPFEKAAFGVGVFTPYGARSRWEEGFSGRFRGYESSLATYYINPSFAYELHPRFRFGAGLDIARATIELTRGLDFVNSEGSIHLGGADWGSGFNVGVQAKLLDNLDMGLHYRSAVDIQFKGKADFQNIPAEFQSRLTDQSASADVTLPSTVTAGLAYRPLNNLMLAFDASWVDWSSFAELAIRFENPAIDNPLPKRWRAKWKYALGAEYGVTEALQVRAGFVYDPSPSPNSTLTPDLPDANRIKVTAGVGYQFRPFRADLGYQFVALADKVSTAPGIPATYSGSAHVFGLTLGFNPQ
ncbi:outer membrane protein transport protein [Corallococcus macrosporus]|uniref:Outer membrane protein transport protein n=1 Tax=Corallococcus macrosporus TaxID=35 RepID=A0ABS3DFJ9_9BACT|nr:outer membrane protein transport protein [Corallococcus macrosporus]MBN8229810.1 outer membrane protein transport protein [Corallococcus macrosporus]